MNKKVTGIFAYIGIVFWLIAFFAGDREGAKVHLNQGLILAIVEVAASILSSIFVWIPLGWILSVLISVVSVFALVLAIIGIVNAATDKDQPLPIIGGITLLK